MSTFVFKNVIMRAFILFLFSIFFFIGTSQSISLKVPIKNAVFLENVDSVTFGWESSIENVSIEVSDDSSFTVSQIFNVNHSNVKLSSSLLSTNNFWRVFSSIDTSISQKLTIINLNNIGSLVYHINSQEGLTVVNNKVSNWNNLITNQYNAVQTNLIEQPELAFEHLNMKNMVKFGGNNGVVNSNLIIDEFLIPDTNFTFISSSKQISLNSTLSYLLGAVNPINGVISGGTVAGGRNFAFYSDNGSGIKAIRISGTTKLEYEIRSGSYNKLLINSLDLPMVNLGVINQFRFNSIGARVDLNNLNFHGYLGDIIIYNEILSDSSRLLVENYLRTKYTPFPDLGKDSVVCASEYKIGFRTDHGYSSITWSNGQTNLDSITATTSGTYWVTVKSFGLTLTDTIHIDLRDKPELNLQEDTISCVNNGLFLTYTNLGPFEYTWSNGSTADTLFDLASANYFIAQNDTANGCIVNSDAVNIQIDSFSVQSTLGPDRSFCLGSNLELQTTSTNNEPYVYNWSTLDTTSFIALNTPASTTLSIEVTDAFNCIARDTITVTVLNLASPSVDFIADTVCFNTASSFLSTAVASGADIINNYTWSFPDNSTLSGNNSAQYTHFDDGTFNVNLSVQTDSNCENSITKPVYLRKLPVVNFNQEIVCANNATSFIENSFTFFPDAVLNYNWFINGALASTSEDPNLSFNLIGKQELKLVVESELGCFNELIDSVEVFPALNADFSFTNNCIGDSVSFTDQTASFSVVDWNWSFNGTQTSSLQNPKAVFNNLSPQQIVLNVENAIGCKSSVTKIIDIKAQPEASFAYDKACIGDFSLFYNNTNTLNDAVVDIMWQIDNLAYTGDSVLHEFSALENYPVLLRIATASGCTDDTLSSVTVQENPKPAFTFTPNYGTAPLEVNFENQTTDATTYSWNFGDDSGISAEENPEYIYTENDIYNISLSATNAFGCSASKERKISVIPSMLDIALKQLSFDIQENTDESFSIKPILELHNEGTRVITDAELVLNLNNGTRFVQNWQGNIAPGGAALFSFDSYFLVPNLELPRYICINAINVNDNTEENFENNKVCKLLNGLIQISKAYPNPASKAVNIDLITEDEGSCTIQVISILGENETDAKQIKLLKGLNKIEIPTSNKAPGKYFIKVQFRDEIYMKPFFIR